MPERFACERSLLVMEGKAQGTGLCDKPCHRTGPQRMRQKKDTFGGSGRFERKRQTVGIVAQRHIGNVFTARDRADACGIDKQNRENAQQMLMMLRGKGGDRKRFVGFREQLGTFGFGIVLYTLAMGLQSGFEQKSGCFFGKRRIRFLGA